MPDQKRPKFDDKGEKYIFCGVKWSVKRRVYKLYNLTIISSGDVGFNEDKF